MKIKEYAFIPAILASIAALFLMYQIVDAEPKNDTMLSDAAYGYCIEIGREYNIAPELLMAIIETESSGNPKAYNGGCYGLMQISSLYHAGRMQKLGVDSIYDEYGNILTGADYLRELFEEYEDPHLVLQLYHGESRAVETYEAGELSEYAETILNRAAELTRLHDGL